ncbi:MAG: hypothetical protein ACFFAH_07095 [Promethearchaeota archaeon]
MGDNHSKSFFGQNTGLIIYSSSKTESFLFIRCIKKKPGGSWEKSTAGEGKVIKCSLDEVVMMLEVLNRKQLNWSSYHNYKDIQTPISFGWENEQAKILWINIGNYSKMLNFAQAEILRLLLTHILKEKIKYATYSRNENKKNVASNESTSKIQKYRSDTAKKNLVIDNYNKLNLDKSSLNNSYNQNTQLQTLSKIPSKSNLFRDMTNINAAIKGETEKALLISFKSGQEIWIPKSTIHCKFIPKKKFNQNFLIDNWILKRNKILL